MDTNKPTIRVLMFDTKSFDQDSFQKETSKLKCCNVDYGFELDRISAELVQKRAPGFDVVCLFVNDICDEAVVDALANAGVKLIVLRCAGFNNVDVEAANKRNIKVARVPAYSPYAVAEHSVALLLSLNRKIHMANNRIHTWDFKLDHLVGFDLHGKTVGIIGTGKIGKCAISIFNGFGCRVLAYDVYEDKQAEKEMGFKYVTIDQIIKESDVISLYSPLTKDNLHMINGERAALMKPGVYIVNTSRGGLLDIDSMLPYIKSRHIGGLCIDVYEREAGVFYNDVGECAASDDTLLVLIALNNVMITSHQAYLTKEALENIATTTLNNICAFMSGSKLDNEVTPDM